MEGRQTDAQAQNQPQKAIIESHGQFDNKRAASIARRRVDDPVSPHSEASAAFR